MTTTPILGAQELVASQAIPETTENEFKRRVEQMAQSGSVKDKDSATPPGSPADGDAYIVAASPTGAWTGHAKSIAYYQTGTGWLFIAPKEGMSAYAQDEDLDYRYGGTTWAAVQAAPTSSITTSETLTAGQIVNIHSSSGAKARKANATDTTKPAHAFVLTGATSGNPATLYFPGQIITGLSSLTPGATYYLDTTGGAITATAPSSSGNGVQETGFAIDATSLLFNPQPMIEI